MASGWTRSSPRWSNVLVEPLSGQTHARRAEALGSRLPPLAVAAERVAATVAHGVHGRRRDGTGDTFWQFRPYVSGDPVNRIDWRHAARWGRPPPEGWLVRQTELDASQTVFLWRDGSASMAWRSGAATVQKRERADLLLLALASLLLRGGERVAAIRPGARPIHGRYGLDRFADELNQMRDDGGLPPSFPFPRHANIVLLGDFLDPLEDTAAMIARLAAMPATGVLLQILDPAEVALPYRGNVLFDGLQGEPKLRLPRVEAVRDAYQSRLKAHQARLAEISAAAGFGFLTHRTDQPPEMALLALFNALGPR